MTLSVEAVRFCVEFSQARFRSGQDQPHLTRQCNSTTSPIGDELFLAEPTARLPTHRDLMF